MQRKIVSISKKTLSLLIFFNHISAIMVIFVIFGVLTEHILILIVELLLMVNHPELIVTVRWVVRLPLFELTVMFGGDQGVRQTVLVIKSYQGCIISSAHTRCRCILTLVIPAYTHTYNKRDETRLLSEKSSHSFLRWYLRFSIAKSLLFC